MTLRCRWVGALCLAFAVASVSAQTFDLQAHRGGRGLLPESTLAAFENALRLGVTTLETDIAITADGVPVLSHNPALNPDITRDASGQWITDPARRIRDLTLTQLQAYDVGRIDPHSSYARSFSGQVPRDGQRIPSLAALFELLAQQGADAVDLDLETKINPHAPGDTLAPKDFVETLLRVIRAHNMQARVMVQSFDWRALEWIHRLEPGMRTVYLSAEFPTFNTLQDGSWTAGRLLKDHGNSVPRMVRASAGTNKGVVWSPAFQNLTLPQIQEAQALGLRVIPWTVNDKQAMDRLMGWGVDGLITDYPDRLRQVMASRGLVLPLGVRGNPIQPNQP